MLPPNLILVYREGLSIPQIKTQVTPEIDALLHTVKIIGQQVKNKDYHPQILYVVVNKKINTRIF